MSTIEASIARFEPISLGQTDEVKLLNRIDRKYAFRADQLPDILDQIVDSYTVLEIGQERSQHYKTLYFDTPDYALYHKHHNKRLNRFKVRSRKYVNSGRSFFEIKFKTNKDRTVKERKPLEGPQHEITGKSERMLTSFTKMTPAMLVPALWIDFSRITLISHEMRERVTIDTMLSFATDSGEKSLPGIVIAEIKQDRAGSSHLSQVLHQMHIRRLSMSKYCLGMCLLHPAIRHNNFKQKVNYLNNLNHDNHEASDGISVIPSTCNAGEDLPSSAGRS